MNATPKLAFRLALSVLILTVSVVVVQTGRAAQECLSCAVSHCGAGPCELRAIILKGLPEVGNFAPDHSMDAVPVSPTLEGPTIDLNDSDYYCIRLKWGTTPDGKPFDVAFRKAKGENGDPVGEYLPTHPNVNATVVYENDTAVLYTPSGYRITTGKVTAPTGRVIFKKIFQNSFEVGNQLIEYDESEPGVRIIERKLDSSTLETIYHRDSEDGGQLRRRRVTTVDSDGAIFSTIYVYHPFSNPDPNLRGRLWFEVGPAGVARMLAATEKLNAGVIEKTETETEGDSPSPQDQCGLDRWAEEGSKPFITDDELKAYASYINVSYDSQGRVTERISFGPGGCGSCPNGAVSGATYVYGENFVEITEPSGLRRVTITGENGLVEFTITTYVINEVQSENFWIEHNIYSEANRLIERRGVLACSNYLVDSAQWVVTPVDSSQGVVELYKYDGDYLVERKRKEGTTGIPHWVSQTEYGQGGETTVNDITVKRPTKVIHYPILTDKSDHDSKRVTTYEYEFYDNSHAIKTLTVTRPAVPTAMNGDGSTAAITRTFYQK
ncbi:MAG: hypothetical protein JJU36_03345, partial [Phycisphaeraceae bacterium]|nr:hypothetical protein [Phycisphaeraceae bacterium]